MGGGEKPGAVRRRGRGEDNPGPGKVAGWEEQDDHSKRTGLKLFQ